MNKIIIVDVKIFILHLFWDSNPWPWARYEPFMQSPHSSMMLVILLSLFFLYTFVFHLLQLFSIFLFFSWSFVSHWYQREDFNSFYIHSCYFKIKCDSSVESFHYHLSLVLFSKNNSHLFLNVCNSTDNVYKNLSC